MEILDTRPFKTTGKFSSAPSISGYIDRKWSKRRSRWGSFEILQTLRNFCRPGGHFATEASWNWRFRKGSAGRGYCLDDRIWDSPGAARNESSMHVLDCLIVSFSCATKLSKCSTTCRASKLIIPGNGCWQTRCCDGKDHLLTRVVILHVNKIYSVVLNSNIKIWSRFIHKM